MKSNPKPTAEYTRFEDALRHVLSVPKAEVMAEIERRHRPREKRKPKTSRFGPRCWRRCQVPLGFLANGILEIRRFSTLPVSSA